MCRDLRLARKVPVGLVQASFGGTYIEKWTPRAYLEADPLLRPLLETYPRQLKQYEQALADYRKNESELKKKHEEAEGLAKAVLEENATHEVALAALGESLLGLRKYDEAVTRLSAALAKKADIAYAYFWRAQAYDKKGQARAWWPTTSSS